MKVRKYCFKTMVAKINGTKVPMRFDIDAAMIDVWSLEASDWVWSDEATQQYYEQAKRINLI